MRPLDGRCMRAFAWFLAASIGLMAPAKAAPPRAASINLCTDELVLLMANKNQVASVTHLSQDANESALWQAARRYPRNDGSLMGVARWRPRLVFTMGGGPRDRAGIADRLGMRVIDLPYPVSLADLRANIRTVAAALGQRARGEALNRRIAWLERTQPGRASDTIWLSGGGRSMSPDGLGAAWLRLAGLRQRPLPGESAGLDTLATAPPQVLIRSNYRARQFSRAQGWLRHPLAARVRAGRTLAADGRRWTCLGPLLVPEIMRLRRELAR